MHRASRSSATFLLITICLALPALLFGQAYFGTVSGDLTDSTGALVQGAKVDLTDQQKGFIFSTTSDSSGRYLFRSVPPGAYIVAVEAQGFGKTQSARFKVDINENATTKFTLKVAGATHKIQVVASAHTNQIKDETICLIVNREKLT